MFAPLPFARGGALGEGSSVLRSARHNRHNFALTCATIRRTSLPFPILAGWNSLMSDGLAIKVLLVDDQPMVGETVRRMLADEPGVEFRFCPDPAAAIDTANEFRPTVILQDLVMPDIDGLQLVKYFRANASNARDAARRALQQGRAGREGAGVRARRQRLHGEAPRPARSRRPRAVPLARLHQPAGAERGVRAARRNAARNGRRTGPRRELRPVAAARRRSPAARSGSRGSSCRPRNSPATCSATTGSTRNTWRSTCST